MGVMFSTCDSGISFINNNRFSKSMGKFLINDIPSEIKSAKHTIKAKASLSPNKMQMVVEGTQLEDFSKAMANEELRTDDSTKYLKDLMLQVLKEQGLI